MASSLHIGDEIDYKRNGTRGTYRCRILAVRLDAPRPYLLEVLSHCWSGAQSPWVGTQIAVTDQQILSVHRKTQHAGFFQTTAYWH